MNEVRAGIDRIDHMMVALLAERIAYIEAAARLKGAREEVRDEARIREVLERVRRHAGEMGVPEELVTLLYERLVEWCVSYELARFDARREQGDADGGRARAPGRSTPRAASARSRGGAAGVSCNDRSRESS